MGPLTLFGLPGSVYTRIAEIVLREKGCTFDMVAVDPFDPPLPGSYLQMHPFARVPVLRHGDVTIHETFAIATYLDRAFPEPSLTPDTALSVARMMQVISVVDAYGYHPLVRKVFEQRVLAPIEDEIPDEAIIATGLAASKTTLAVLDRIAAEGLVLSSGAFTLACAHLVPMIACFRQAPEGLAAMAGAPHLSAWWDTVKDRRSIVDSARDLP
ncbi:MAG: glutathione S-transferase family protein [Pseudomonadota bacterium]